MPLIEALRRKRVVVLPDLFIDALVPLPRWPEAEAALRSIASRGGGNLPVPAIEFRPGGNAANLGLALARLGAQVDLVARTDALGKRLLHEASAGSSLGLDLVQTDSPPAVTIALECPDANVMLSHAGPVADFGPEGLDEAWDVIEAADAVAVVNWSQNRRGTALLEAIADRCKAFLYLDTGDPRHRHDAASLLETEIWPAIGAWGLNENELRAFSGDHGDIIEAAGRLARRVGTRLDLHTRTMAVSVHGDDVVHVPAQTTPARRLTGAGDAWNAGNLAGHLLGMATDERLHLAHATASRHVGAAPLRAA